MRAIDYIESLEKDEFRIERCRLKIERLENLARNLSSKPFDNDRIQSSGSKDRIGDLAVKIIREKERYNSLIAENEEKKDYIDTQIDKIENVNYSKVIFYIHVERRSYNSVADLMDKEVQTIRNMHTKAMKELEKTFVIPE